jgi:hypothetical protein
MRSWQRSSSSQPAAVRPYYFEGRELARRASPLDVASIPGAHQRVEVHFDALR